MSTSSTSGTTTSVSTFTQSSASLTSGSETSSTTSSSETSSTTIHTSTATSLTSLTDTFTTVTTSSTSSVSSITTLTRSSATATFYNDTVIPEEPSASKVIEAVAEVEQVTITRVLNQLADVSSSLDQQNSSQVCSSETNQVGETTVVAASASSEDVGVRSSCADPDLEQDEETDDDNLDDGPDIHLPASVFSHLNITGSVVVVLSSMHNISTESSFGAGLTSAPVSFRLLDENGNERRIRNLPEPIILKVAEARTPGTRCAFWDEDRNVWSTVGVSDHPHTGMSHRCATTHLTVFGPVLESFLESTLVCSNVRLLSKEGLEALGKIEWMLRPAGLFFLAVVLLHLAFLARSVCIDRLHRWDRDDRQLFLDGHFPKERVDSTSAMIKDMFSVEGIARNSTRMAIAYRHGLIQPDVDKLIKVSQTHEESKQGRSHTANLLDRARQHLHLKGTGASMLGSVKVVPDAQLSDKYKDDGEDQIIDGIAQVIPTANGRPSYGMPSEGRPSFDGVAPTLLGQNVLQSVQDISNLFWASGFCERVWIFFVCLHPWAYMGQFSITMRSFHRALLITARLMSSGGLCALFFSSSGDAMSYLNEDACETGSVWAFLRRNLLVGAASMILSTIPILLFSLMHVRRFVYSPNWDEEKKQWYLWWWTLTDRTFEAVTSVYSLFWMGFLALFLANVSAKGGLSWIMSTMVSVLRDIIIFPALTAVALAVATKLIENCRPRVTERAAWGEEQTASDAKARYTAWAQEEHKFRPSALPSLAELDAMPFAPVVPHAGSTLASAPSPPTGPPVALYSAQSPGIGASLGQPGQNADGLSGVRSLLAREASKYEPGMYVLVRDSVPVRSGVDPESMVITKLARSKRVEVLEVADRLVDGCVRGRIASPPGWISLGHPASRTTYANLLQTFKADEPQSTDTDGPLPPGIFASTTL